MISKSRITTIVSGTFNMFYILIFMLCACAKLLQSCLTVTLWPVACQSPLSMGFSRQVHCALTLGILSIQGSNPRLLLPLQWRRVLYHSCHLGSPMFMLILLNSYKFTKQVISSSLPFYRISLQSLRS